MITRIEIDGFKSFDKFELNFRPFSAVVGPNASGKSNLFDALRFLSALAQDDIRSAMQALRGEPLELFRITTNGSVDTMKLAIEVILPREGLDPFGTSFYISAQRIRYEVALGLKKDSHSRLSGIRLLSEKCEQIHKKNETLDYVIEGSYNYSYRKNPFMNTISEGGMKVIEVRQDGVTETGTSRRGRPLKISAGESTRTALSAVSNAEFPHLFALKELLSSINFLEINPNSARKPSDIFEEKKLRPDASNLAAVLAYLKDATSSDIQPDGCLNDISMDLSSLISSVSKVEIKDSRDVKEYDFSIRMSDGVEWSSRVISDGTLRLLALLAIVDDPFKFGVLCFEEPENGVHEGRVESLIDLLRDATYPEGQGHPPFQILINTHSPAVLRSLDDQEVIVSDTVRVVATDGASTHRTRMRSGVVDGTLELDPERILTRSEIDRILKRRQGHA
ncbi:AAA family ATPase [Erythrobacter sp. A6_0]|uniref:AAA family ATPase n=1 Tax=Erythrobacter sp. A6_0 TaxID=2821089 RepID=UPI001ADBE122|nr:AAA family ATPase [Erythrobacter sp. A6_0]MBO9510233.1 AAA family ATPase [Erythrobacter sp. A6_0]